MESGRKCNEEKNLIEKKCYFPDKIKIYEDDEDDNYNTVADIEAIHCRGHKRLPNKYEQIMDIYPCNNNNKMILSVSTYPMVSIFPLEMNCFGKDIGSLFNSFSKTM